MNMAYWMVFENRDPKRPNYQFSEKTYEAVMKRIKHSAPHDNWETLLIVKVTRQIEFKVEKEYIAHIEPRTLVDMVKLTEVHSTETKGDNDGRK